MEIVKRFMIMQMEEGIIIETSISGQEKWPTICRIRQESKREIGLRFVQAIVWNM